MRLTIILGWVIDQSFYTNTFTIDVDEDTGSNLNSNVFFVETLARASLKACLPGSPGIETTRTGPRTAVCGTRYRYVLKVPLSRGGYTVTRIAVGCVI